MVIGGGIYSWDWNNGVKFERMERAHERYLEAMKNNE